MARSMVPKCGFPMRWCKTPLPSPPFPSPPLSVSCDRQDADGYLKWNRMIFLFRSGTVREKLALIFRATRIHAQNLAKYASVYKLTMLLLKHASGGKEGRYDTFFAGLLGGYLVFGRRSKRGHISSVSKQIVIFGAPPLPPSPFHDF